MKITKVLLAVTVAATLGFGSCKPKDSDVKAAIETKIAATPEMAGAMVDVKDGVATISGMVKDDACKAMCEKEISGIKGVKSVVNNCSVTPPPPPPAPAPAAVTVDAGAQQKVKDGLKDIPAVSVDFVADKAVLTGAVTKAERLKIMQILASAGVKSDVSGLTDKK